VTFPHPAAVPDLEYHLSLSPCGGARFTIEQLVSQLSFINVTFIHLAAVPNFEYLDRLAAERAS